VRQNICSLSSSFLGCRSALSKIILLMRSSLGSGESTARCLVEGVRQKPSVLGGPGSKNHGGDYHSLQEIFDTLVLRLLIIRLTYTLVNTTVIIPPTNCINISTYVGVHITHKLFARTFAQQNIYIKNIPRCLHTTEKEMGPLREQ